MHAIDTTVRHFGATGNYDESARRAYLIADAMLKARETNVSEDPLAVEYAHKILKHIKEAYHPNGVWFTNVTAILTEYAERVLKVHNIT